MLLTLSPELVEEAFELVLQDNKTSKWKNPRLLKKTGDVTVFKVKIDANPWHIFGLTIKMPKSIKAYNKIESNNALMDINIISVNFYDKHIIISYMATYEA